MGKYKKEIGFILLLVVILTSCSPVARFTRLVKKHPYLIQKDTVTKVDTIRINVPLETVDSVFQLDTFLIELHDTITVTKDRLKVEIFRVKDSIIVNGKCDTVYIDKIIERKIPVKYYQVQTNTWKDYKKYAIIGLSILFLIIVLILIIKLLQVLK